MVCPELGHKWKQNMKCNQHLQMLDKGIVSKAHLRQCRVSAFTLSEHHRFHPHDTFSALETLQSHPPAPENLLNGQS